MDAKTEVITSGDLGTRKIKICVNIMNACINYEIGLDADLTVATEWNEAVLCNTELEHSV